MSYPSESSKIGRVAQTENNTDYTIKFYDDLRDFMLDVRKLVAHMEHEYVSGEMAQVVNRLKKAVEE